MRTLTIGQFKSSYKSDGIWYRIYKISEGDCVLYVGKSKDAVLRILDHLGLSDYPSFWEHNRTALDRYLMTPEADGCTVMLYSIYDIYHERDSLLPKIDSAIVVDPDFLTDLFEKSLIWNISPVFNRICIDNTKRAERDKWIKLHPQYTILWGQYLGPISRSG